MSSHDATHMVSGALLRRQFIRTVAAIAAPLLLAMGARSSAQTGADLFFPLCGGCHDNSMHPKALVYNAAGNVAIIEAVIARGMQGKGTLADRTSVATYLDSVKPTITLAPVANDSTGTKINFFDIIVNASEAHAEWKIIDHIETVSAPTKGTVTYKAGNGFGQPSIVTYKPFPGQSGIDTWTYRGIGPDEATSTTIRTASVTIGEGGSQNYQGLWWNSPAGSESGWGINLAHQGDTIFASWFTYDTMGRGWWLVMTATKTGTNTYSGKLYQTRGPAFNAVPFDPATVVPIEVGAGTLVFTDANNGTFNYVIGAVNQTKTITREVFATLPVCTFGAVTDLATAINYQDLWWKLPANSESGWGINLNHQSDTIFATWFTYDLTGAPLWLVVTATKTGPGVYTGDLYQTSGPPFNSVPFDPTKVVATKVGTATFTVINGNDVTFAYSVQLGGMAAPAVQTKPITREIFTAPGTTCK